LLLRIFEAVLIDANNSYRVLFTLSLYSFLVKASSKIVLRKPFGNSFLAVSFLVKFSSCIHHLHLSAFALSYSNTCFAPSNERKTNKEMSTASCSLSSRAALTSNTFLLSFYQKFNNSLFFTHFLH